MSMIEIGCCGAYCKTCLAFVNKTCKGCKIGYENGERGLTKAKCEIKVCCLKKKYNSCADCSGYAVCSSLTTFYSKKGYKYGKYHQATRYMKEHGYQAFIEIADTWKNAFGKYD